MRNEVLRRASIVSLVLTIPLAQTVQAMELLYTRAIGEEYMLPPPRPQSGPAPESAKAQPELPALGTAERRESPPVSDDVHARAIGQEFMHQSPQNTGAVPPADIKRSAPELPALGTNTVREEPPSEGFGKWSKVLIGIAVVGAIAALGGGKGGSSGTTSSDSGGSSTPPPSGGSGGGSSGGGSSGGGSGSGGGGSGGGNGGGGGGGGLPTLPGIGL